MTEFNPAFLLRTLAACLIPLFLLVLLPQTELLAGRRCAPILQGLSHFQSNLPPETPCPPGQLELISIDTLLYIENRGLERLFFNLNGHDFKLAIDPEEIRRSSNAFLIPRHGALTIHIGRYIYSDRENCINVRSQGPAGADADLLIADLLVPGQQIAYFLEGLTPFPEQFALEAYPNPFSTIVHIAFAVPEQRTAGVEVLAAIYDMMGRRVRILTEGRHYPGRHQIEWDGKSDSGAEVAAGLYLVSIVAAEVKEVVSVVYIR